MSDGTHIQWSDATWNPVTGCTRVSEGCLRCYIERTPPFRMAGRKFDSAEVGGTTGVTLHPERLDVPLGWRKPRRVFVNSLSDLFHEDVPDRFIVEVFARMWWAPQHTFQVLTKRHARMRSLLNSPEFFGLVCDYSRTRVPWDFRRGHYNGEPWPLPNVWLGVSAEDQKWADIRIPALLETPAAVRWISAEPLLGPIDLSTYLDEVVNLGIDWVVAGGESGLASRPMHPEWARSLRDRCTSAGVSFFFKQWGGRTPKANGRELDGREWNEYPQRRESK